MVDSDFGSISATERIICFNLDGFWNNVNVSDMLLVVEEEMLQPLNDTSSASVTASLSGFKRKRTQSCEDVNVSSSSEDLALMNSRTTVNKPLEQRIADALLKKCVSNAAATFGFQPKYCRKCRLVRSDVISLMIS